MIMRQNGAEDEVMILLTTFPDSDLASQFGTLVVESQLAACANLLPGVKSIYRWKDAVQVDAEVLLILKTTRSRAEELERVLQEFHPYDVPEVLLLSPESGSEEYMAWVRGATNRDETAVDKAGS
jgi:periplasmic divalent cation tolerance protein